MNQIKRWKRDGSNQIKRWKRDGLNYIKRWFELSKVKLGMELKEM